jgi:hypothetical protein
MKQSTGAEHADEIPAPLWTGRIEVDLLTGNDWQALAVEIVVRIETVTVWLENRTLAVMDRDRFRDWLKYPRETFDIDDLLWTVQDGVTCLLIDRHHQYIVPLETATHMATVM